MDMINTELLKAGLLDRAQRTQDKELRTDAVNRKSEISKVAKEMEALFVHELIKVMRKTSESIAPDVKGAGNETYMSLFDMEVSKALAGRGLGLQKAIEGWLERRPDMEDNTK
ncbi:MAG: hypothetical protein C4526_03090 [Nitrospiraceae bacterium]|nr:MAG: hypothetical protein C4526_03090 [Nitrospiraceae bacterium]